jgi:hypothetical protein
LQSFLELTDSFANFTIVFAIRHFRLRLNRLKAQPITLNVMAN